MPRTHVLICHRYVNKTFCQSWHASTIRPCWDFLRRGNNYQPDRTPTTRFYPSTVPETFAFCGTLLKLKAMMLTTNLIIRAMHVFVAQSQCNGSDWKRFLRLQLLVATNEPCWLHLKLHYNHFITLQFHCNFCIPLHCNHFIAFQIAAVGSKF